MKKKHISLLSVTFIGLFLFGIVIAPENNLFLDNGNRGQMDITGNEFDEKNALSASSSYQFIENIELAESTARYIYNNRDITHTGPGFAWPRQDGNLSISYGEGAAGIGSFFLELYETTMNSTYLNWANEVGVWLNNVNFELGPEFAGKWPIYESETIPNNYTGLLDGAAGVGMFLTRLYKNTLNTTYKSLSEEVSYYITNSAMVSPEGTGLRIPYREYVDASWATIQPNTTETDPVNWTLPYGSYGGGGVEDVDNTADWAGNLQIDSEDTSNYEVYQDIDENNKSYIFGLNNFELTEVQSIFQTIRLNQYPFYIDPTEGIKLFLNSTGQFSYYFINVSIHEVNSLGNPSTQIGDQSNGWYIGDLNNSAPGWVTFNWSGLDVPILNGSSVYGYCIKINFNIIDSTDNAQYFNIFTNSNPSSFTGGSGLLKILEKNQQNYKTLYNEYLVFNMTSISTANTLQVRTRLNGNEGFGLNQNNEKDDIASITIQTYFESSISMGTNDFALFQIFNYGINRWETIDSISITSLNVNQTYILPQTGNYITGSPLFTIQTRIIAGSQSAFNIQIRQYNISIDIVYESFAYSWGEGIAGIGEYFLECYRTFRNLSYLSYASQFANFLVEEATIYTSGSSFAAFWNYNNEVKFDLYHGSAGIGRFLNHLSIYNSSTFEITIGLNTYDVGYSDIAFAAANHISLSSLNEFYVFDRFGNLLGDGGAYWIDTPTRPLIIEAGILEGFAGIGMFLLEVLESSKPTTTITNQPDSDIYRKVRQIANFITAEKMGMNRNINGSLINNLDSIEFRIAVQNGIETSMKWSDGTAGILTFLSALQQKGYRSTYGDLISMGMNHINEQTVFSNDGSYWNGLVVGNTQSNYSFINGLAGIGLSLLNIGARAREGVTYGDFVSSKTSIDWSALDIDYSIDSGIAGIAYSYLEQYKLTKNSTYYFKAQNLANHFLDSANWTKSSFDSAIGTGFSNGLAGLGNLMMEMYLVSNDVKYLNASKDMASYLVNNQSTSYGAWSVDSVDTTIFYTSFERGSAGIVKFLLDMYLLTNNETLLETSEIAIHGLLQKQDNSGFWVENFANPFSEDFSFNGYYSGTAGIADVLLFAYDITGNSSYLTNATNAMNYLCDQYTLMSGFFERPVVTSTTEYIGLQRGYAGYWKALSNFVRLVPDNEYYYVNLTESIKDFVESSIFGQELSDEFKKWDSFYDSGVGSDIEDFSYLSGSPSLLSVLSDIAPMIQDDGLFSRDIIYQAISMGKNYIIKHADISTMGHGYLSGINGLAVSMSNLPNTYIPEYSEGSLDPSSNPSVNYDTELKISFEITGFVEEIMNAYIIYSIDNGTFKEDIFTRDGSTFEYTFYSRKWNTQVRYYIVIRDYSFLSKVILNPTGDYFAFTVGDTVRPEYTNLEFRALLNNQVLSGTNDFNYGASGGGYVRLRVLMPTNSSGIDEVNFRYRMSGSLDYQIVEMQPIIDPLNPDMWDVKVSDYLGQPFVAGNIIYYTIELIDNAGNINSIDGFRIITDLTPPILLNFIERPFIASVKEGSKIPISVNVTDFEALGGSGISNVTIFYSNDDTLPISDWEYVNCTKADIQSIDGSIYRGEIPGQGRDKTVYYFIRITDNFGNINSTGTISGLGGYSYTTDVNEIPAELFSLYVEADYTMIIIIIASIVGALVIGYAVFKYRGSYMDRMRRSATEAASLINIQEKFLKAYYAIAERLEKVGEKMSNTLKNMRINEKLAEWGEENVETPTIKAFKFIGSWVGTFLKYGFFVGLTIVLIVGGIELSKVSETPQIYYQQNIGMVVVAIILAFLFIYPLSLKLSLRYREEKASFVETLKTTVLMLLIISPLMFGAMAIYLSAISFAWKMVVVVVLSLLIIMSIVMVLKSLHSLTTLEAFVTFFISVSGLSLPLFFVEAGLGKIRTKKILVVALMGLVMIVATVVKYFTAPYYPARAIFFIDFGFVLFIGSFVAIIVHLAFNIITK